MYSNAGIEPAKFLLDSTICALLPHLLKRQQVYNVHTCTDPPDTKIHICSEPIEKKSEMIFFLYISIRYNVKDILVSTRLHFPFFVCLSLSEFARMENEE